MKVLWDRFYDLIFKLPVQHESFLVSTFFNPIYFLAYVNNFFTEIQKQFGWGLLSFSLLEKNVPGQLKANEMIFLKSRSRH